MAGGGRQGPVQQYLRSRYRGFAPSIGETLLCLLLSFFGLLAPAAFALQGECVSLLPSELSP